MALTAAICSEFCINTEITSAATYQIANPGRGFKILTIQAFNAGGVGNLSVSKDSTAVLGATSTTNGAWKQMSPAAGTNMEVTSTQYIEIICAGAGWGVGSQVIITCVATAGGQALTVS